MDLKIWNEQRADPIRKGVGQPFLIGQGIGEAHHILRPPPHADDDGPTRRIGEGHRG